jgi:hypothetical protein
MAQEVRVLCIQDTTELDFTSQPGIAGLGRLTYERQHGMYMHPTLAVSEGGVALGVLDAWMWSRKPKGEADVLESLRWTEGYGRVAELAARLPGTRLVYMADREGDLRALVDLAAEAGHPADCLVRARHDRAPGTAASCAPRWSGRHRWARWSSGCRPRRGARSGRSRRRCGWRGWNWPGAAARRGR